MSIKPMPRLNQAITHIDTLWQQQVQIDWANLELMRQNHFYAQVWGLTVPACIIWQCQIVEGSISEVRDDAE